MFNNEGRRRWEQNEMFILHTYDFNIFYYILIYFIFKYHFNRIDENKEKILKDMKMLLSSHKTVK